MEITAQQRKFALITAGVVLAAYFAPSIVLFAIEVASMEFHPSMPKASPFDGRQNTAPQPLPRTAPQYPQSSLLVQPNPYVASSGPPDEETALPAPASLAGKWQGQANTDTGICQMKLEIVNPTDMPGIKGYGSMTCMALGPLVATQPKGDVKTAFNIVRRTTPAALLLSGKLRRDGAIRFHVDNIIGPPPTDKACAMTFVKVAPFASGVVAQWEDGCKGGQAMLSRMHP
jgi:hypothetical protein